MDNKPMWVADRVVALNLGFAITIPETVNEFSIKETSRMELILERICGLFRAERMSAKGEKIVRKSPVFIGQTGGAST
ncbi:hypothetical protein Tco_0291173 [Tanacetum coccineum]